MILERLFQETPKRRLKSIMTMNDFSKKPQKKTKEYYDYGECSDYLQEKYGYNERDYAGKHDPKKIDNVGLPHQDFWYWLLENYDVHNGCFITFMQNEIEKEWGCVFEAEPWVKEIYSRYIEEFADEHGNLIMWIWW